MPSANRPLPPRRRVLTRRHALTLPLLTLAVGAVAACNDSVPVPTAGAPSADGSSTPGAASPSAAPTAVDTRLENVLGGHTLDVRIGPLVRVDESSSILCLHVDRPSDDPIQDGELGVGDRWVGTVVHDLTATRPLRMVDPGAGRVWVTTRGAVAGLPGVKAGGSADYHPTFGGVGPEVTSVTVMLSDTGFFEVPVVDAGAVPDLDAQAVLKEAEPDQNRAAPLALERYVEAVDRSTSELTTDDSVKVTVSNDVSFESDSADLSADAEGILKGVSDTIASYPDGGALTVTGHTDDVADDAYNQTLSEKRAQAVSDRLGQLTPLSAWTVQTTGKGETEPRAQGTDDAARAANRRVEIVITPTGGTKPDAPQSPGGGDAPQAAGPSAKGPDGVSVSSGADDPGVTIVLDKVTRRGGLLFGEFVVSGNDQKLKFLSTYFRDSAGFGLNNARGELGGVSSIVAASGVTLISGGNYVFPVDYLPVGADSHRPLADLNLISLSEDGRSARICMAWPDTGEKTVIVDRPADSKYTPVPWRLTDVPVEG